MICVSIGRGRHRHMMAEHKHLSDNGIQLVELRLDYINGEVQVKLQGTKGRALEGWIDGETKWRFSGQPNNPYLAEQIPHDNRYQQTAVFTIDGSLNERQRAAGEKVFGPPRNPAAGVGQLNGGVRAPRRGGRRGRR